MIGDFSIIPFFAAAGVPLQPSPWMLLPFVLLLGSIALMPLCAAHFWERHYPKVAVGLGLVSGIYYLVGLHAPVPVAHAAQEYLSFMALIGSLYVISGGINISVKGVGTPLLNTGFLLVGAVLANIIGTTGASMLLIRPWIRMNRSRITQHHIVFFIFVVSNCGGCLTPIGDPPLFLGFLRGVPFWWILEQAWSAWLLAVGLLLAVFYVVDSRHFSRARVNHDIDALNANWGARGTGNALFLLVVLIAVFIPPSYRLGNDTFNVPVSALIMVAAAVASYRTTARAVHEANDFNFHPVKEVGFIFIGIFLTMMPALDLLKSGGDATRLLTTPQHYYFATGALSAFLDNAPTYLAFLAAEMGAKGLDVGSPEEVMTFVTHHGPMLLAVSLGAVFFGAGSYIGNGPNFMVKAIADKAGVKTPSFMGYIFKFAIPILLPILVIAGWVLLR